MRGCTGLAALSACLAAFPASAQSEDRGEYKMKDMGREAPAAERPFDAQRMPAGRPAPAEPGTRLISTVPVADNFDLGIGIFSVVGETEKETVRRRTDPSHEIISRRSKVAAVGLSLRF